MRVRRGNTRTAHRGYRRLRVRGTHELLIALPYLLAVLASATFVGRAAAPAAIGRPFARQ
ncbi:hypothetical protein ACIBJE_19820 [Micromonospora sp. NPDC050187]|uniref:hypothetical protein n=1 Tax=Micromonospora sp. NPDC050187 TaxID=3364277 RepID=UPI0037B84D02